MIPGIHIYDEDIDRLNIKSWINNKLKKSKNLSGNIRVDEYSLNFAEIRNEFVKMMKDSDSHRYLKRFI